MEHKIDELIEQKRAIVVYGASSENIDPAYKEQAHQLGRLIAEHGYALVSGGGRAGLMKESIEGAVGAGGVAIGVLPQFMVDRQWQHPQLSRMIATDTMHIRKQTMASMVSAAIACPGGCGTLEELLEIITWRQLNLFRGRIVILNVNGYYDPLLAMLNRTAECGFMHPEHKAIWQVATTAAEAIELALMPADTKDYSQKIH